MALYKPPFRSSRSGSLSINASKSKTATNGPESGGLGEVRRPASRSTDDPTVGDGSMRSRAGSLGNGGRSCGPL